MDTTTRISELPLTENITSQYGTNKINDQTLQNTYIPMNIHPNPYGSQHDTPNMLPPQQPQCRIPSRDIPINTCLQIDEQVQPNYIPNTRLSSDYVLDYEKHAEHKHVEHSELTKKKRLIDILFTELQTPFFIMLLFFIFQMPFINGLMIKYLAVFSIYNTDGNMNVYGYIFKSILFGLIFYGSNKLVEFMCE